MRANAPQLPGGGWAQLELTDALEKRAKNHIRDVFRNKLSYVLELCIGARGEDT